MAAHYVRDEGLAHRDARDRHRALRGCSRRSARRAGLREDVLPPDATGARARNEDSENVQPARPGARRTPAGALVTVNPYVFIVGCPRSGTTLLQRIVDAHPDIAVVFETHWIPRLLEKRRGDYNFEYLRESYGLATDHMRRIYNGLAQLHELKPGRHKKRVCER